MGSYMYLINFKPQCNTKPIQYCILRKIYPRNYIQTKLKNLDNSRIFDSANFNDSTVLEMATVSQMCLMYTGTSEGTVTILILAYIKFGAVDPDALFCVNIIQCFFYCSNRRIALHSRLTLPRLTQLAPYSEIQVLDSLT